MMQILVKVALPATPPSSPLVIAANWKTKLINISEFIAEMLTL